MGLQVKTIKQGIMDFGPAIGIRGLFVYFKESNKSEDLFKDFKDQIEKNALAQEYLKAVDGTQSYYLYFIGGNLEKKENYYQVTEFFKNLSSESLDIQKTLRHVSQMRPPFMVFVGYPKVFSGNNNFYQNFNCIVGLLDPVQDFSGIAAQEILNHQFSSITIIGPKKGESHLVLDETIKDLKKTYKTFKINIFDQANSDDVRQISFNEGVRYYSAYKKSKYLINVWRD